MEGYLFECLMMRVLVDKCYSTVAISKEGVFAMTMQCSLGHWLGSTRDRPWERAILLLNFPSVTLLPAVVDNHWMAIIELWYSETFSCHTTTEHDSQILRNQLAHILGNQLATLGFIIIVITNTIINHHYKLSSSVLEAYTRYAAYG